MCNLYRMSKNTDEVAKWFDLVNAIGGANFAEEVYPGHPGLVAVQSQKQGPKQGQEQGQEQGALKQMTWGFPLVMTGRNGQSLKAKPVNNARTDKLDSYFWRSSFEQRRCLIPMSAWAEAQGEKGAKTRTWMSRPDEELFAVAGVWQDSDEFGLAYSMVMTDSAGSASADIHSRMPVVLHKDDYQGWLSGTPDEAKALCVAWTGDLIINKSDESWIRRAPKSAAKKPVEPLPAQRSLF